MSVKWKYINFFLILASISSSIWLIWSQIIDNLIIQINNSALGVLLTGTIMASSITILPSLVILMKFNLHGVSPFVVTFVGAFGGMIGDYLVYTLFRQKFADLIEPTLKRISKAKSINTELNLKIFHTPYLFLMAPVVGAIAVTIPRIENFGLFLLGTNVTSNIRVLATAYLINAFLISALITIISF